MYNFNNNYSLTIKYLQINIYIREFGGVTFFKLSINATRLNSNLTSAPLC